MGGTGWLLTWKAQTVAELTLGANPTCAGATVTSDDGTERKALDYFLDQQVVELDPDVLNRWPDGCILEPKVKAGIAEVRVYATD